jgi:hypothetical protein
VGVVGVVLAGVQITLPDHPGVLRHPTTTAGTAGRVVHGLVRAIASVLVGFVAGVRDRAAGPAVDPVAAGRVAAVGVVLRAVRRGVVGVPPG